LIGFVHYSSPVGFLRIAGSGEFITECGFSDNPDAGRASEKSGPIPVIKSFVEELDAYFSGTLRKFSVGAKPAGTPFCLRVWEELLKIPCGATATYKDVAKSIGNPNAARAVGGANHKNPIVILIPCHRVVGADGRLVGYGGGLDKKEFLLGLEGADFLSSK